MTRAASTFLSKGFSAAASDFAFIFGVGDGHSRIGQLSDSHLVNERFVDLHFKHGRIEFYFLDDFAYLIVNFVIHWLSKI